MKKVLFSSALMLAAAISFAGTPKGETKEAKSETSTKTDAQMTSHTYFVTGKTTVGSQTYYIVTETDPGCPDQGNEPCEVLSNDLKDSQSRIKVEAVSEVLSNRP